jgi:hypothetical protein
MEKNQPSEREKQRQWKFFLWRWKIFMLVVFPATVCVSE